MKGTGAKRNVCPGSCVSTGAQFPVAPVESAPMLQNDDFDHQIVTFLTGFRRERLIVNKIIRP